MTLRLRSTSSVTRTDPVDDDVVLRPAVATDVGAMGQVYVEARRLGRMPNSPWTAPEVAEMLAVRLGSDVAWVAEESGQVVAYVRFVRPDAERIAWVDDLYVHPATRRRGIGGALLDVVRSDLAGGFGLWVFAENHPARRFYASQGLVEVEETDGHDNPEGVPEVRMEWSPDNPDC